MREGFLHRAEQFLLCSYCFEDSFEGLAILQIVARDNNNNNNSQYDGQ